MVKASKKRVYNIFFPIWIKLLASEGVIKKREADSALLRMELVADGGSSVTGVRSRSTMEQQSSGRRDHSTWGKQWKPLQTDSLQDGSIVHGI